VVADLKSSAGAVVARRFLQSIPLLLVVSIVVFLLIHAAPGGPLAIYLSNPNVRPQDIERLRHSLGLDRPLVEQYAAWVTAFARGDWGYSFSDGRPVTTRVWERVPATVELVGSSLVLAFVFAIPVGIFSAVRRGGWFDRAATTVSFAAIALPVFWFGLVLQLVFAVALGWLPSAGRMTPGTGDLADRLAHIALPAGVLAFVQLAVWSRYLRASMSTVLSEPFILAVVARGVPRRRVIVRHALANAVGPMLTIVLVDAALLASGAVVTESVFAWPGIGSLFTEALARRDYTVLMALLMLSAVAVVVFNLIADVLQAVVDPRARG
jgi:peptide/nickel transport system permease protein